LSTKDPINQKIQSILISNKSLYYRILEVLTLDTQTQAVVSSFFFGHLLDGTLSPNRTLNSWDIKPNQ